MSTVLYQARKLSIITQLSDLNYQLMILSGRMQLNATRKQGLTEVKSEIQTQKLQDLIDSGVENISLAQVQEIQLSTADYDVQLQMLANSDDNMDAEMRTIETKIKALDAELENLDKAEDQAIKNEFKVLGN